MHLTDARGGDGHLLPIQEDALRRVAELVGDHLGGERRCHRLGVGLQCGQGLLRFVGKGFDDEAEQLPELHESALHVAELAGDVFGGADRELLVERVAAFATVAQTTHAMNDVATAVAGRESPDPSRAAPMRHGPHTSRRAVGLAASRSCGSSAPVTSSVQ